ncbi:hypothetical protein AM1_G0113 (plasmid) [Acaryochloris marina MBIC11017]|uniref:Uncharacterized protein n=1 Tax=Acaryochloris marina (strain MBIC 11017) TaxID=329726 RepID=A8ZQK7_ACAM1|nr:hypothetical protein AM1_G0113 [Acaryochloris marina MBIC11017]
MFEANPPIRALIYPFKIILSILYITTRILFNLGQIESIGMI